jgi:hypothetical protein
MASESQEALKVQFGIVYGNFQQSKCKINMEVAILAAPVPTAGANLMRPAFLSDQGSSFFMTAFDQKWGWEAMEPKCVFQWDIISCPSGV